MKTNPADITTAFRAISFISSRYHVSLGDLDGHCREWRVVWPRWLAMLLIKRSTPMGLRKIAYLFDRYPTAIQHALRAVENEVQTNQRRAVEVAEVIGAFELIMIELPFDATRGLEVRRSHRGLRIDNDRTAVRCYEEN